jgi:hypothetical protein
VKSLIKNIAPMLMAAVVLISTSGFAVFRHSCQAEQSIEYSFANAECNCISGQQEIPAHSCCELPSSAKKVTPAADKCCATELIILKLDTKIDIQDIQKKIHFTLIDLPVVDEYTVSMPDNESKHILISNDLPPPLSGRSLHIFLHQLNIPFPSV